MILKKISILFLISILFTGCQTIKEKSNAIAEKENKEYGKLVGKNITELKIKLGNPTEDFINERISGKMWCTSMACRQRRKP
jgi:hypothetical protein